MPKHDGQEMVASRAPQCSQRVASVEADAPHIGQLSVWADMRQKVSTPVAKSQAKIAARIKAHGGARPSRRFALRTTEWRPYSGCVFPR